MKKIVLAGLIAISLMAFSRQPASAWVNSRFGVGLNWHVQSAGNQVLWGAWKNGQVPGPEMFGQPGGGFAPHLDTPQFHAPMPQSHLDFLPSREPSLPGQYSTPFHFANYPRPVYYYSAPTYSFYGR